MTLCDDIQNRLAEDGPDAALDSDGLRHLEGCAACTAFRENLQKLEHALDALPSPDAPDALVEETLAAVRNTPREDEDAAGRKPGITRYRVAVGLAASVVIAAVIGVSRNFSFLDEQWQVAMTEAEKFEQPESPIKNLDQVARAPAPKSKPAPSDAKRESSSSRGRPTTVQPGTVGESVVRAPSASADASRSLAEPGRAGAKKRDFADQRHRPKQPTVATGPRHGNEPFSERAEERFHNETDLVARLVMPQGEIKNEGRASGIVGGLSEQNKRGTDLERGSSQKAIAEGAGSEAAGRYRGQTGAGTDRFQATPETKNQLRSNAPRAAQKAAPQPRYALKPPGDKPAELRRGDRTKSSKLTETDESGHVLGILTRDGKAHSVKPPLRPDSEKSEKQKEARRKGLLSDEQNRRAAGQDKDRAAGQFEYEMKLKGESAESLSETKPALKSVTEPSSRVSPPPAGFEDHRLRDLAKTIVADNTRTATAFMDRYGATDGLMFKDPTGYWVNTYIPGDPAMRLLEARLNAWDRRALGTPARLERRVRQVGQPFDAPAQAAMAVYLHADKSSIQGPTRLRVQVGLKGAQYQGGRRPAMNVGLVLDLRTLTDARAGTRFRALIDALEQARQPGDRFSLTVAGPGGGVIVPPETFRHGPLRVAIQQLFGGTTKEKSAIIGLPQAIALATENVRQGDDPNAVLGTSLVLLATGGSLATDLPKLESMAHTSAVGGIAMSVVSLGAQTEPGHVDRLVAAGQGRRRMFNAAVEAKPLVERELHAASRAVARAVRLKIRLAPGVKLIDVLGSRRLNAPRAQRVREAEKAIDQRLARNLGIQADRGQDEDGIQIVIPSFFADDAHVVLLDVVASRPGPVADVTVRYKDVVNGRNGVAQAELTVGSDPRASGPLERNVLKNLVAWHMSREIRMASRHLAAGDARATKARLNSLVSLTRNLRVKVPGWSTDPVLAADEKLLIEYATVLNAPASRNPAQRRYLTDSLRYAAFRKLQTAAK